MPGSESLPAFASQVSAALPSPGCTAEHTNGHSIRASSLFTSQANRVWMFSWGTGGAEGVGEGALEPKCLHLNLDLTFMNCQFRQIT